MRKLCFYNIEYFFQRILLVFLMCLVAEPLRAEDAPSVQMPSTLASSWVNNTWHQPDAVTGLHKFAQDALADAPPSDVVELAVCLVPDASYVSPGDLPRILLQIDQLLKPNCIEVAGSHLSGETPQDEVSKSSKRLKDNTELTNAVRLACQIQLTNPESRLAIILCAVSSFFELIESGDEFTNRKQVIGLLKACLANLGRHKDTGAIADDLRFAGYLHGLQKSGDAQQEWFSIFGLESSTVSLPVALSSWAILPAGTTARIYSTSVVIDDSNLNRIGPFAISANERQIFDSFRSGHSRSFARNLRRKFYSFLFDSYLSSLQLKSFTVLGGIDRVSLLICSAGSQDDMFIARKTVVFIHDLDRSLDMQVTGIDVTSKFDSVEQSLNLSFVNEQYVFCRPLFNSHQLFEQARKQCEQTMRKIKVPGTH